MGLLDSVKDKVEGQLHKRQNNQPGTGDNDNYGNDYDSNSVGQSGNDSYGGRGQGGDEYDQRSNNPGTDAWANQESYDKQGERAPTPLPHMHCKRYRALTAVTLSLGR